MFLLPDLYWDAAINGCLSGSFHHQFSENGGTNTYHDKILVSVLILAQNNLYTIYIIIYYIYSMPYITRHNKYSHNRAHYLKLITEYFNPVIPRVCRRLLGWGLPMA